MDEEKKEVWLNYNILAAPGAVQAADGVTVICPLPHCF